MKRMALGGMMALGMTTACDRPGQPPREPVEPCQKVSWYADNDGDGFGDPMDEIEACGATCHYSATNAMDCDDGNPAITALAGSTCPVDMAATDDVVVGHVGRWSEYIAVTGGSGKLDQYDSAAACAAWGGHLATWSNGTELHEFMQSMSPHQTFAGYIGVVPGPNGGWTWVADSPLVISSIGWCRGQEPSVWDDDDTLVLFKHGYDWCVGRPDDANQHYVCERPRQYVEWYTD